MAEAGTLHDAFIDELRDTYDAERQLTKALAKLAKAATAPELQEAFQSHLEETQGQIQRLEQWTGVDMRSSSSSYRRVPNHGSTPRGFQLAFHRKHKLLGRSDSRRLSTLAKPGRAG